MRNIGADWVIPCNLNYYDVFGAFANLPFIDWRQTVNSIEEGDIVYIYVGKPIQAIMFKCKVERADIPAEEMDDSDESFSREEDPERLNPYWRYMRLKLVGQYKEGQITLQKLHDVGMKGNIQGARHVDACMMELISSANLMKE